MASARAPLVPPEQPQFLTTRQAANMLGLSTRVLEKWRLEGRPPSFVKFGWAVRYSRAELDRFAAEAERRSTADPGPKAALLGE